MPHATMSDLPQDKAAAASGQRLVGWKAIAKYAGISVATARRWEDARGLPVHRVPGPGEGSVFANSEEIDAWFESATNTGAAADEPSDVRGGHLRASVMVLAALTTLLALAFFGTQAYSWLVRSEPATVRLVDGRHWVVEDIAGNELWRRSSSRPLRSAIQGLGRIVDLDGSGRLDVVVVVPRSEQRDQLVVYDARGNERWTYTPGDELTLAGETYDSQYQILAFTILTGEGGERFIALSAHHRLYYPAQLTLLDTVGEPVSTYVHAGWITTVGPVQFDDDPADELIFGAINNPLEQPALGVLDVPFAPGLSPGIERASGALDRGVELAYLALPRTRTSATLSDHSWVDAIVLDDHGGMRVQVNTAVNREDARFGEYIYDFQPGLRFERAHLTDIFHSVHNELRSAGRLDFAIRDEVELGPPEWLVGRSPDSRTRPVR